MSRPTGFRAPHRVVCLVALYLSAVPIMYACGDDSTRPGASGDDTSSSSGGADSAFHDVAVDTAKDHTGDGSGSGDGTEPPDGADEASENDVFIDVAVFEAAPLKDEGVASEHVIPLDGPQMIGDDGGD
jgi:hypothetical protein